MSALDAKPERNAAVVAAIRSGAYVEDVSRRYGISAGRVLELVARADKREGVNTDTSGCDSMSHGK